MREQLGLALDALALCGEEFVLELSHMDFITGLLDELGAGEEKRPQLLDLIRDNPAGQDRQLTPFILIRPLAEEDTQSAAE